MSICVDLSVRPEYDFDYKNKPRSELTGLLLHKYVRGAEKEVRTFLIVVLWIVLVGVAQKRNRYSCPNCG